MHKSLWKSQIIHRQCLLNRQIFLSLLPHCKSRITLHGNPTQWEQNLAKDCWKSLRDSDAHIHDYSFHPATNIIGSCLIWLPTTGFRAVDTHSLLKHLCCLKRFWPHPTPICHLSLLLSLYFSWVRWCPPSLSAVCPNLMAISNSDWRLGRKIGNEEFFHWKGIKDIFSFLSRKDEMQFFQPKLQGKRWISQ